MMILIAILILASFFAIFWTIKTKKTFPGIISFGMVVGILMVILPIPALRMPGLYLYMAFVAVAVLYSLIIKSTGFIPRIIIFLIASSILVYWVWVLNHWHGNTLLLPIFTLLLGLVAVTGKYNLKNESGFLVILVADAITILLENLLKTLN